MGELVSEADREWAKQWRIEHSQFTDQIAKLTAKARSYRLLLDSARRAFKAKK